MFSDAFANISGCSNHVVCTIRIFIFKWSAFIHRAQINNVNAFFVEVLNGLCELPKWNPFRFRLIWSAACRHFSLSICQEHSTGMTASIRQQCWSMSARKDTRDPLRVKECHSICSKNLNAAMQWKTRVGTRLTDSRIAFSSHDYTESHRCAECTRFAFHSIHNVFSFNSVDRLFLFLFSFR